MRERQEEDRKEGKERGEESRGKKEMVERKEGVEKAEDEKEKEERRKGSTEGEKAEKKERKKRKKEAVFEFITEQCLNPSDTKRGHSTVFPPDSQ